MHRKNRMTRKTRGGGWFKKNTNEEFGEELNAHAKAAAARRAAAEAASAAASAANRSRAAAYSSKTKHAKVRNVFNPLHVVSRSKETRSKARNVNGVVSTANPLYGRK
jgi:membrane protein involved in colicin uptake